MNRLLIILLAVCLLQTSSYSQSLDSSLNVYNNKFPQEKIHIHFDKDAYLPGETVWMKAYLMNGTKPSEISKNVYFDWTDADGRLLLHSIAPVSESGASSFFQIPSWVKNGVVHVKAYTQWMLNFDNEFLFNKDIPVLMPIDGSNSKIEKIQTSIRFYPEGGDLINGVNSLLAFEALNQDNRPVVVRGVIKNTSGEIVDSFKTNQNGLGTMRLKPVFGEHYTAYWKSENGSSQNISIPDIKSNGLVLHADAYNNDQIHYRLEKSKDASNLTKVIVIGTINQKVVYRNSLNLENNKAEAVISAGGLPCGVMQLTAFDMSMSPLAERVVFVNNDKVFAKIQLKNESVNTSKRGRNEISLEMPDSIVTNLSVSVTDAGLGYDSSYNIYSSLLVAGDLKGNIHQAVSALMNPVTANENINLLLLTHGWRKFNWETVVSGKFPELKYPQDAGFLSIKGLVRNSNQLDDQDSISLLMISRDRKKHVLKMPVDADGKFGQHGLFFYDSVQIVYRFNHTDKLNDKGQISLTADLLPAFTPAKADEPGFEWVKVPEVILDKEMNGNLIETNDYSVASKAMSYIVSPKTDSMGKYSESASHYLADNFADLRFPPTLKDNNEEGEAKMTSYKPNASSQARNNVNITLDGTAVAMNDLKTVNMKEVLFIKFIPKSNQRVLPTLAITSRQALEQANILENKTGYAVITGYTPIREFYQPKYDSRKIEDYQATDFRSTLYWNPTLRLDKAHRKMNFVFYNNDVTAKFRIVVEGMSKDGKLCHIEEIIKPGQPNP